MEVSEHRRGSMLYWLIQSWEAPCGEFETNKVVNLPRISHRWLDETPTGRIIARCTQDIGAVDGPIPQAVASLTNMGMTLVTKLVVIVIFTPMFLFPAMAFTMAGFSLGNLYLRAQLSVKREMRYADRCVLPFYYIRSHVLYSNARSPLLAHFSAAIAGIGKVHLLVHSILKYNIIVNQFQFVRTVLRFLSKTSLCRE
jgi:ABC-type multidrug transport system fused ATPase/permease subunit